MRRPRLFAALALAVALAAPSFSAAQDSTARSFTLTGFTASGVAGKVSAFPSFVAAGLGTVSQSFPAFVAAGTAGAAGIGLAFPAFVATGSVSAAVAFPAFVASGIGVSSGQFAGFVATGIADTAGSGGVGGGSGVGGGGGGGGSGGGGGGAGAGADSVTDLARITSCGTRCYRAAGSIDARPVSLGGAAVISTDDGTRFELTLGERENGATYLAFSRDPGGVPRAGTYSLADQCSDQGMATAGSRIGGEVVTSAYTEKTLSYLSSGGTLVVERSTPGRFSGHFDMRACLYDTEGRRHEARLTGTFDVARGGAGPE